MVFVQTEAISFCLNVARCCLVGRRICDREVAGLSLTHCTVEYRLWHNCFCYSLVLVEGQ